MDSNGVSWVGNIYQKFEAMCQEAKETLNEDAVKFVESQVQNVGSNVKKLYSEVMHDQDSQDSADKKGTGSCEHTEADKKETAYAPISNNVLSSQTTGSFPNCDKDVIETIDRSDPKMKFAYEDKNKLDETCVFVKENNISFASYKDGKPQSYNKKMGKALSLNKKSRRQEYKTLMTRYEDVEKSSSLTCVNTATQTLSLESKTPKLQTPEFCESDWEFV